MNTTPFMDKQIMDLTQNNTNKDFIDLMNHPNNHHPHEDEPEPEQPNGITKDDIVPSYDFQPIRPLAPSTQPSSNYDSAPNFSAAFSRPWNSDSISSSSPPPPNPIVKSYSALDSMEPAKVIVEKDQNAFDPAVLSEIDRTMKKHTENLLHVMEGISARLTQLESRTHRLENSVDDLKVSVGNNHGSTDGKLRQIENILREVQTGVQTIKDKQDIVEAQLQLAKLQMSKMDQQSETQTSVITDPVPVPQAGSAPQQSQQQLPAPINLPQSIPAVPPPNAPPQPPPSQQGLPPPVQLPNQFSQNQIPAVPQSTTYFPPSVPSQETPNQQQYQMPLSQPLPHPPAGAPPHQQQYQQTPQPPYPQPPASHLPQQQPSLSSATPPQLQSSLGHHVEETPYVPSQSYAPNLRQPPTGPPPSQQFYGAPPPHAYESPSSRPVSAFSSGYSAVPGPAEPYRYGGSAQYGATSAPKPPQLPTASVGPGSGSGYPQLPTARVLPQALPTASAASGGSSSPGAGSRVSIDDVVDKVASMGFPRDHVRATVRKLTENGQSVDLNAVLDKLMNEGEVQPQRTWFGR